MAEYLNLPKADYSSNLVAKWVFDDTDSSCVNGTRIYDLSGNGNNLTSYNVTYIDDADLGRCAYFNGSSSYAQATSTLIPANTYTVIFEIKVMVNTTYNYPTIFDTRGLSGTSGSICYISGSGTIINLAIYNGSAIANSNQVITTKNEYSVSHIYMFNIMPTHKKISRDDLSTFEKENTGSYTGASSSNKLTLGRYCNNADQYGKFYIKSMAIYNTYDMEFSNNAYLIKDGNSVYSFKDDEYTSPSYNEITDTLSKDVFYNKGQWDISKLALDTTIGSETFKPLSKFTNPQIVSYIDKDIKATGRKSNKQLIVASRSFATKIVENIDHFKATANMDNASYIKVAVSNDEGVTWKTTSDNGTTWTDLTSTIPLKEYSSLTTDEKTQWNNALTEIDTNGISITNLENIDFNPILSNSMMFAYVMYQDTYASVCDNLSLEFQFDSKGKMQKMADSEYDTVIFGDSVTITSKIDNDMIKVNILNGVPEGGSSSDFGIDNIIAGDNIEIEKDDVNNTVTINANVDVSSISGSSSLDLNSLPYFGI